MMSNDMLAVNVFLAVCVMLGPAISILYFSLA